MVIERDSLTLLPPEQLGFVNSSQLLLDSIRECVGDYRWRRKAVPKT